MSSHICRFCRKMVPDRVALVKTRVLNDNKYRTDYYHPSCFQERQKVPTVDKMRKVSLGTLTPVVIPVSPPSGASFLIFSGTVLFIGIILVLANAVRERPVYADEPVSAAVVASVPLVSPPSVPVALPTPVTVVERVVYVPSAPPSVPKSPTAKRSRSCKSNSDCPGTQYCTGALGDWGKCRHAPNGYWVSPPAHRTPRPNKLSMCAQMDDGWCLTPEHCYYSKTACLEAEKHYREE